MQQVCFLMWCKRKSCDRGSSDRNKRIGFYSENTYYSRFNTSTIKNNTSHCAIQYDHNSTQNAVCFAYYTDESKPISGSGYASLSNGQTNRPITSSYLCSTNCSGGGNQLGIGAEEAFVYLNRPLKVTRTI